MKAPLLNFEPVGIPMDRWHFLFDPTGSLAGVAGSGFTEQGGARAVSIYSLGESSFREGTFTEQTSDSTATIDNTQVQVHSSYSTTKCSVANCWVRKDTEIRQ